MLAQLRCRRNRSLLVWGGLLVSGVFGWLAVRHTHPDVVWALLQDSDVRWVGPSFALLALAIFLRAVRWRYLFRPLTRPPIGAVTSALLIGSFFNNILPGRVGEAARVVALKQRAGTSRAEIAATVVIERVFDVLSLLVLLFIGLPWLPSVSWARTAAVIAAVVVVGVAGGAVALAVFAERPVRLLLRPLSRLPNVTEERVDAIAGNVVAGFAVLQSWRLAAAGAFWTISSWIVMALSYWLLMRGFDLALSPIAGMFVVIAIGLALILPAAAAGVGTFEAATVVALQAYGVSSSKALSYALVLHAVNFVPYIAAGLVVLRLSRESRIDGSGSRDDVRAT